MDCDVEIHRIIAYSICVRVKGSFAVNALRMAVDRRNPARAVAYSERLNPLSSSPRSMFGRSQMRG